MKTKNHLPGFIFFLVLTITFIPAFNVTAQQITPSDDEVNAIARQLYCPVCENTPLDVCPTTACHQWRELIRQMLAEGKSESEIKQYFVDYYGARVLSEPPRTGINWLVYIVPPAAFLSGVILLFFAFRTWRKGTKEQETGTVDRSVSKSEPEAVKVSITTADEKYVSQLEEELKKRK